MKSLRCVAGGEPSEIIRLYPEKLELEGEAELVPWCSEGIYSTRAARSSGPTLGGTLVGTMCRRLAL